jgi:hypothetical protein
MKRRCLDQGDSLFQRYGGRGIGIHGPWARSFEVFQDWALNHGYAENLECDRINNDGDYAPGNCRWVTSAENKRNTSRNRILIAFGEAKCITDWAADPRCSVTAVGIHRRLQRGIPVEAAIAAPRLS